MEKEVKESEAYLKELKSLRGEKQASLEVNEIEAHLEVLLKLKDVLEGRPDELRRLSSVNHPKMEEALEN